MFVIITLLMVHQQTYNRSRFESAEMYSEIQLILFSDKPNLYACTYYTVLTEIGYFCVILREKII